MRTLLAAVVGVLVVMGVGCRRAPRAASGPVQVSVSLHCASDSVNVALVPWTATLRQGDSIDWVLDPRADGDSLVVSAKTPGDWPFENGTVYHASREAHAQGRRMIRNAARADPYRYTILATCRGAAGPRSVVIDPDMIIR